MDDATFGALKRIIEEIKDKRRANCLMKDCIVNDMIGGNDIDLVDSWIIKENKKIGFPFIGCTCDEGECHCQDCDPCDD
jgi:hypothetical protein